MNLAVKDFVWRALIEEFRLWKFFELGTGGVWDKEAYLRKWGEFPQNIVDQMLDLEMKQNCFVLWGAFNGDERRALRKRLFHFVTECCGEKPVILPWEDFLKRKDRIENGLWKGEWRKAIVKARVVILTKPRMKTLKGFRWEMDEKGVNPFRGVPLLYTRHFETAARLAKGTTNAMAYRLDSPVTESLKDSVYKRSVMAIVDGLCDRYMRNYCWVFGDDVWTKRELIREDNEYSTVWLGRYLIKSGLMEGRMF
jgi:hypothetical protein